MERFKQEKITVKILIREICLDSFVNTTKEFKKLDELENADEIINTKKNEFDAWSTMVFIRVSYKRKYGELIHNFCIKYKMKNNKYPKNSKKQ